MTDVFSELLQLDRPPVAIAFTDAAPAGLERVAKPEASSCSYWRLAEEGRTFYTEPEDHQNCPIGAHTHNVPLPEDKAAEAQEIFAFMVGLDYISEAEVQRIPQRSAPLRYAAYAPYGDAAFEPDVVLVRGNLRQMMLLGEAAHLAGLPDGTVARRPTCQVLPETIGNATAGMCPGCIGNRVYTELDDTETYFAIPGAKAAAVADSLKTIAKANDTLRGWHSERKASI